LADRGARRRVDAPSRAHPADGRRGRLLSKKTLTPLRALHVPLSSESDATGYSYSESDD